MDKKSQFRDVADAVCPKPARDYIADPMREAASSYDVVGYPEFWVRRDNVLNVEEANILLNDIDIEVRLHMIIDGKKRGYFVCFGPNKDFTELWFHSEDWNETIRNVVQY